MFCGTASLALFLAYSQIFYQNQGFHKIILLEKKDIEDFEIIAKSPHFLHLTYITWFVLKIRLCFDM